MTKFEKIKANQIKWCTNRIKEYKEHIAEWKNKTLEEYVAEKIHESRNMYELELSFDPFGYIRMDDYDKLVEIGKIYFSQEEEKED